MGTGMIKGLKVQKDATYSNKVTLKREIMEYGASIFGTLLYAIGLNVFIVPFSLYSGGFVGISQIIRTICTDMFHMNFGNVDVSGIIFLLINIPLLFLAITIMGRRFLCKTIVTTISYTLCLTIIMIPGKPLVADALTSCIIGGIISGIGSGIVLWAGSSGGGTDILGIYFSKKYRGFSVGKLNIGMNLLIYLYCALAFNIETAIYSIIYTAVSSVVIDKLHFQNINMTAMIFTKKHDIEDIILKNLNRGVTYWDGKGAYTNTNTRVIVTVISKYEVSELKKEIEEADPEAFVILNEGIDILGNFEKRL
ncbi:YitT family protein [Anaeromicropila herbilytica]|uniref:Membrane protein n=1 Tax=Anaeromicropila herbilytica TaxID=2785025 RepID=A0A7R7EJ99_9FIRM|nr:YitT family protein [Anaeromicropila herbilytica]BCN29744.1 membrane protein [Anaeromicropila herbilytica]